MSLECSCSEIGLSSMWPMATVLITVAGCAVYIISRVFDKACKLVVYAWQNRIFFKCGDKNGGV